MKQATRPQRVDRKVQETHGVAIPQERESVTLDLWVCKVEYIKEEGSSCCQPRRVRKCTYRRTDNRDKINHRTRPTNRRTTIDDRFGHVVCKCTANAAQCTQALIIGIILLATRRRRLRHEMTALRVIPVGS